MEISGKVIIITGASSGIGAATARELARHGATLVLAARREDELVALQAEIKAQGGRALAAPTDVRERADLERLVQATLDTYGRIDVLVNNAGVSPGKRIAELSDDEIRRVFDVNLLAPARLVSLVVPQMRQQGGGIIVNIGSVAGEVATSSIYAATKFGIRGLNDALRRELWHDGITLVLIAPGFIRTAMTRGAKFPMPGPELIARAVADGIRRPRRKIIAPWYYRPAIVVAKLLPAVADAVLGSKLYQSRYRQRKRLLETTQPNQKG